jgi:hypothetical protein
MKLRNHSLAIYTMLLLGTAAFLGGCVTTGMDRTVKTAATIQDVDNELREIIVQIDVTGASLDSLVMAGQPDLKKAFDTYSADLAKLDSQGKQVIKRIEEMKLQSTEYFAEWEKRGDAYTNPQIRELSDERRKKLAEIYAQVPATSEGVKRAYLYYLTDLKEIQIYLSNNLTPIGVEAITPVTQKSAQDRDALKTSLKPVIAALDDIKAELYSGTKSE